MELFAPRYYKSFRCIADKCRHSCCVGWEIDVDSSTYEKYEKLPADVSNHILSQISEDGCIKLKADGKCPFLDGSGLCRLISDYGDEMTSRICREHPRFYNKVCGRTEVGVGAVCEEACRLILSSDEYCFIEDVGECSKEAANETDFDTVNHRNVIYGILNDKTLDYRSKLSSIADAYSIPPAIYGAELREQIIGMLELLNEDDRAVISACESDSNSENYKYYERFLAYLVYRHVSVAENLEKLRSALAMCLFLADMHERAAVYLSRLGDDGVFEAARMISEEIEYSEENVAALIFEFECML